MKKVLRSSFLLIFLIPMIFLCGLSGLAQTSDYWLKMERKGTGYGYEHIKVTKLPDGNLKYNYNQHLKTDVAGLNPQDITQEGHYVVDKSLKPISLDVQINFLAKKSHLTGKCENNLLTLTKDDGEGQVLKQEILFQDVFFDISLPSLILKNVDKKNFKLKIFDQTEVKVKEVQVRIIRVDKKEVEAAVSDLMTTRYRINRKGQIKEARYIEINSRSYLTNAADAQNIRYLNTADGYTLTVKSQKSFPNIYKVTQAQIQVRWKNIPFEEFSFVDNRQQVVKKTETGSDYEVILEMSRFDPRPREIAIPVQDEKFSSYLAETDYIKPHDPSVRKQLAEIQGDEKNAFKLVEKILRWVSTNIKSDYIAETLTGPEVLQKKRGKCSEYTILFASLARAAGIPTRLALGELGSGNLWQGHMWDEVWLGEWMAVDASAGSFVSGPTHLKFIDSPTVMGTQKIRWKLTDNLSIEILDFKEEEARAGIKTGIFGETYFNQNFSCKISAPDKTWTMEEKQDGSVTMLEMSSKEDSANFALVFFVVPAGMNPKKILEGRLNAIRNMVKNFERLEESELEIAGQKAPSVVFKQSRKDQSIAVVQNCLLIDGTNGYLFVFATPEDKFEKSRPQFQKVLASFEIIK